MTDVSNTNTEFTDELSDEALDRDGSPAIMSTANTACTRQPE